MSTWKITVLFPFVPTMFPANGDASSSRETTRMLPIVGSLSRVYFTFSWLLSRFLSYVWSYTHWVSSLHLLAFVRVFSLLAGQIFPQFKLILLTALINNIRETCKSLQTSISNKNDN